METLTMHYEIKEESLVNGELTEVFLNNTEASFGKMILDFIKLGNVITILKYFANRGNVEVEKEVIGVDTETGEQTKLIEKTIVESYSYTAIIELLRTNIGTKQEKCERNSKSGNLQIIDGKIVIPTNISTKAQTNTETVVIIEHEAKIPPEDKKAYDELELQKQKEEAEKLIADAKKEEKKNKKIPTDTVINNTNNNK
jgi:hypothetical protein